MSDLPDVTDAIDSLVLPSTAGASSTEGSAAAQGAFAFASTGGAERVWSPEQQAIFDYFGAGLPYGHATIDAYAGTGKSTTLVEAVRRYHLSFPRARVLACAFNVRARDDLIAKFASAGETQVDVKTLHQLGMRMVSGRFRAPKVQINASKGRDMARKVCAPYTKASKKKRKFGELPEVPLFVTVAELASLAKNTLAASREDVAILADEHGIFPYSERTEERPALILQLVEEAMGAALADTTQVDFDDQLWFPVRYAMNPSYRYDLVLVDEGQDLTAAQLWLADRMLDDNGRLVIIGDKFQAIYKFRSATGDNFDALLQTVGGVRFKLSTTYRCAKAIVTEAQKLVPDFQAAHDAPAGSVDVCGLDTVYRSAGPGDFVLSRFNAPLLPLCLFFVRQNKRARIAGKDFSRSLRGIVEGSEAGTILDLRTWLRVYTKEQRIAAAAASEKGDDIKAYQDAIDRALAVEALCEGVGTIQQVFDRINRLFSEEIEESDAIVLSTVHQVKGREAARVYLLEETFKARNEANDASDEERNILYVAITRAKETLFYVRGAEAAEPPATPKKNARSDYFDLD